MAILILSISYFGPGSPHLTAIGIKDDHNLSAPPTKFIFLDLNIAYAVQMYILPSVSLVHYVCLSDQHRTRCRCGNQKRPHIQQGKLYPADVYALLLQDVAP